MKKADFIVTLQNNTNGTIAAQLFQPSNVNDVANATTRYRWETSIVSYSTLNVSIQVRPAGSSGPYTVRSGTIAQGNAASVVSFLNSLGIGTFWQSSPGSTIIETYNNQVEYGDLVVGQVSSTIEWQNNTLIAGGDLQIDRNSSTVVTNNNPGFSGSSFLAEDGDSIDVFVNASPGEPTDFTIYEDEIPIYSNTVAGGGSDSHSFTVNPGSAYEIVWGAPL